EEITFGVVHLLDERYARSKIEQRQVMLNKAGELRRLLAPAEPDEVHGRSALRGDARRELDEQIETLPQLSGAAAKHDPDVCRKPEFLTDLCLRRAPVAPVKLGIQEALRNHVGIAKLWKHANGGGLCGRRPKHNAIRAVDEDLANLVCIKGHGLVHESEEAR